MNQSTFIEKVADKITKLGLAGPAILLLEANKPLAFIGSQLLLVAQPTVDLFLSPRFTQHTIDLLADSSQLEQLINSLEIRTIDRTTTQQAQDRDLNLEEAQL